MYLVCHINKSGNSWHLQLVHLCKLNNVTAAFIDLSGFGSLHKRPTCARLLPAQFGVLRKPATRGGATAKEERSTVHHECVRRRRHMIFGYWAPRQFPPPADGIHSLSWVALCLRVFAFWAKDCDTTCICTRFDIASPHIKQLPLQRDIRVPCHVPKRKTDVRRI